jgi:hypothetical protein
MGILASNFEFHNEEVFRDNLKKSREKAGIKF